MSRMPRHALVTFLAVSLLAPLAASHASSGREFHVSPKGDDGNGRLTLRVW
jgi:hypothetical protein